MRRLQQFRVNNTCKTGRKRAKSDLDVPRPAAVKPQRPIASEEEHRVLEFRPRHLVHPVGRLADPGKRVRQVDRLADAGQEPREPNDLSRYERAREEPDDFRHRMLANVAAFAFTVALTAIGIWLAMSIADLRRTQDCVLLGRRDCVHISTPNG
jgi:hypothetical protein